MEGAVEITSKDVARYFREQEKERKWAAIERQEQELAARGEAALGGAVK